MQRGFLSSSQRLGYDRWAVVGAQAVNSRDRVMVPDIQLRISGADYHRSEKRTWNGCHCGAEDSSASPYHYHPACRMACACLEACVGRGDGSQWGHCWQTPISDLPHRLTTLLTRRMPTQSTTLPSM